MHTLVHLSDLHIGSAASVRVAQALVRNLLELRAGTVLVTGDVTDGRREQWQAYREIFAPLQDRLVTLPGNHDRCHDDVAREITDRRVWTVKRRGLHVVCVDSTADHNRKPYRSHGAICAAVLEQIDASLGEAGPDALRVVALHHHLVPLPVEGIGEWFADLFGWPHASELGLGRELLRRILGRCDLVLHGHRHIPRELVADAANGRTLRVFNAGSSTQLAAFRVFDVVPGAYSYRWHHCAGERVRKAMHAPAMDLAVV
jgi:3',5'-cyclic AMP phosphodiesterase CpdA